MDTSTRLVEVALIVVAQSYDKRCPLFLMKDNKVLSKPLEANYMYTPNDAVSDILKTHLDIDYHKGKGSENWVTSKLEAVLTQGENGVLVVLYSCLIPEQIKPEEDGTLQWKTIDEILSDVKNIEEYDRKLISNFATGGE